MRGHEYSDHKSDAIFVFGRLILVFIAILLTPLFVMELDSGTLFKGKFWTVFLTVYSLVLIFYSAKSMFKTIKNVIALFKGQNRDKIKPIKFMFRLWILYSAVWLFRVSLAKLFTFVW